jgi:hypothetical protein
MVNKEIEPRASDHDAIQDSVSSLKIPLKVKTTNTYNKNPAQEATTTPPKTILVENSQILGATNLPALNKGSKTFKLMTTM